MKRPKVSAAEGGREPTTMTMELTAAFEEIALGEAELPAARRTISKALGCLDEPTAARLYEALRSWVWKTLEARRRDDELTGWLDVLGRVSSHLDGQHRTLAIKLEACVELLHTSVAHSSSPTTSPFQRKHVRRIMKALHRSGGSLRKRELQAETELKEANLSRVLSPLRDEGWVVRSMDGKEAIYRLTEAGRCATPPDVLAEAEPFGLPDYHSDILYHKIIGRIAAADGYRRVVVNKDNRRSDKNDDGLFLGSAVLEDDLFSRAIAKTFLKTSALQDEYGKISVSDGATLAYLDAMPLLLGNGR